MFFLNCERRFLNKKKLDLLTSVYANQKSNFLGTYTDECNHL